MKNLKSVLAMVMALCLMLCLAVPAFATETTEAAAETTVAVETTEAAAETTEAAAETTEAAVETTEAVAETVDEHAGHDHAEDTLTVGATAEPETTNGAVKVIRIIVIVLEVIASIALIAIIMMQSGKESGLGSIAGNSDSYMNKGNAGTLDAKLASYTKWVAVAWIVLTLVLALLPNA